MIQHTETAVVCRGVKKVYGEGASSVQALRGVDLEVRSGELLMLVGPSGCGKTTLISVIAGILDPTGGECIVFGENLAAMPQSRRTAFRGKSIGFVFQAYNLLPALSAAENVAVPLLILGQRRAQALQRAQAALEKVGMGDRSHSRPSQLSGGQQQRVAIARALVHDPRLVVCDEPTSALDADTGQRVMSLLREVAIAPGRALVIVTHDSRTFHFADRIARMDDGHIESITDNAAEPASARHAP
ncbi:MAG: ABC transporter ATP-binding protein [Planctomycetota bacterium]|nr:ABC transporter ATP-binding protein [Planctomycetota bacterium]